MLIYFAVLLAAANIIYWNNRRRSVNRYAALFLLCASLGGLAEQAAAWEWVAFSEMIQFLNYTATPYFLILFCIVYTGKSVHESYKLRLKLLLLIPIVIQAGAALLISQHSSLYFIALVLWAGPYYLYGCCLLAAAALREEHPQRKRNRLVTAIIMVPSLLAVVLLIYVAKAINPAFPFFNYVSGFLVFSFGAAALSIFIYGVLGVKLSFERDPLEDTMKAVGAGTTMLNHTIKNEVAKIEINAHLLSTKLPGTDSEAEEQLRMITQSAEHLNEMASRIHSMTKDFILHEQILPLAHLLEDCLTRLAAQFKGQQVKLQYSATDNPLVVCDPVHIREAIHNICSNALEAMQGRDGELAVRLTLVKGRPIIEIKDNGKGFEERALKQAFDPFYSSGKDGNHFGLGLSYVHQVMKRSGGNVLIESIPEKGTKVSLLFSKTKVRGTADEGEYGVYGGQAKPSN